MTELPVLGRLRQSCELLAIDSNQVLLIVRLAVDMGQPHRRAGPRARAPSGGSIRCVGAAPPRTPRRFAPEILSRYEQSPPLPVCVIRPPLIATAGRFRRPQKIATTIFLVKNSTTPEVLDL